MYSEYFELYFASIRSHNSWSDILTLCGVWWKDPRGSFHWCRGLWRETRNI